MEEIKKKNIFLKILFILFIIFFSLYLMENLGYYNINTKNKILTEKSIEQFEKDVKEGKSVDIKEYVVTDSDYSNIYSNIGYKLSDGIDIIFNKGFKKIGKLFKKLFQ